MLNKVYFTYFTLLYFTLKCIVSQTHLIAILDNVFLYSMLEDERDLGHGISTSGLGSRSRFKDEGFDL